MYQFTYSFLRTFSLFGKFINLKSRLESVLVFLYIHLLLSLLKCILFFCLYVFVLFFHVFKVLKNCWDKKKSFFFFFFFFFFCLFVCFFNVRVFTYFCVFIYVSSGLLKVINIFRDTKFFAIKKKQKNKKKKKNRFICEVDWNYLFNLY